MSQIIKIKTSNKKLIANKLIRLLMEGVFTPLTLKTYSVGGGKATGQGEDYVQRPGLPENGVKAIIGK